MIFSPSTHTGCHVLMFVSANAKFKDSASVKNINVAFYREYSRYRYLYFTTGKQWSKDLLGNKGVSVNIPTYLEPGINVMIGVMFNDTQGINL